MKYLLEIAYKGSKYHGWQKQPEKNTIQGIIENTLSIVLKETVKITGAGRTDKGVHAKQQFAHFEISKIIDEKIAKKYLHSINSIMKNEDIIVKNLQQAPQEFHARYQSKLKTYQYQLLISDQKDPFLKDFCFIVPKFDIKKANQCAKLLIGEHDFSSFKHASCSSTTQIRSIKEFKFSANKKNNIITATIKAQAFLQHQIRIMIGTIFEIIAKEEPAKKIKEILQKKDRSQAGPTAPANGLTLIEIIYQNFI